MRKVFASILSSLLLLLLHNDTFRFLYARALRKYFVNSFLLQYLHENEVIHRDLKVSLCVLSYFTVPLLMLAVGAAVDGVSLSTIKKDMIFYSASALLAMQTRCYSQSNILSVRLSVRHVSVLCPDE